MLKLKHIIVWKITLLVQFSMDYSQTSFFTPTDCEIQNVGGFLQNVCDPPPLDLSSSSFKGVRVYFKCTHSDQYFYARMAKTSRSPIANVDILCKNDPNFYQACASVGAPQYMFSNIPSKFLLSPGDKPCGYLCQISDQKDHLILNINTPMDSSQGKVDFACDGIANCLNTDLDEIFCEDDDDVLSCDMICDTDSCVDESYCNGFSYGLWCDNYQTYLQPVFICLDIDDTEGSVSCNDNSDKAMCSLNNNDAIKTCTHSISGRKVPISDFDRCAAIIKRVEFHSTWVTKTVLNNPCKDFMDQTNCTDYSRVGLYCSVRGYMTTVSNQVVCISRSILSETYDTPIPPICDDYLDKACVSVSTSCEVHKHQMCDGLLDCEDGSDEKHEICFYMSDKTCIRRYVFQRHNRKFAIPMTWVHDGISDCMDNDDESETWPQCGFGPTRRFKDKFNSSCEEVFLCEKSDEVIDMSRLCDKINSCGNENQICEKSRSLMPTYGKALRKNITQIFLSYCIKGVDLAMFSNVLPCNEHKFSFSMNHDVFGRNHSLQIYSPKSATDCGHFFGESYVFMSCLGLCENLSPCPLNITSNIIKFNSCPRHFESEKVYSVSSDGHLTFLIANRRTGLLGNDIFVCENTSVCLTYDKVCDLVDDCGDGSDESSCNNHFQCETSKEFLHLSQKCDGTFHCMDRSDECNDTCGGTIVGQQWLKIVAWIIGILAICLNFVALAKNFLSFKSCKSEAALLSSGLVIVIHIGDLLGGLYLTVLASFDAYRGNSHCKNQSEWLTSYVCIALGITSTIGLQMSLFSMAALSLIRVIGISNDMRVPKAVSRKSIYRMVILIGAMAVLSSLVSCLPILSYFEDFFVNGIKFDNSNTLFLGCLGKKKLLPILQEYYGRMHVKIESLSWSKLVELIKGMFSADHGGILHTRLSFYGNDPVCVFKYFVGMNDPQRNFTVILLCLNICSIATITASYSVIATSSRKNVKALSSDEGNKINANVRETDARLQRVVHAMIVSDFMCWIPFTFICGLHLFGVLDAKPWYPVFSIVILPLNCIINPILYERSITRALDSVFLKLKRLAISNLCDQLLSDDRPDTSAAVMASVSPSQVIAQNKNSNSVSPSQVIAQNKNSNSVSPSQVIAQNKNSNNSCEATVLEQNKNSNNSNEAIVLEQKKKSNNSREATALEQSKNSNNSSEATGGGGPTQKKSKKV